MGESALNKCDQDVNVYIIIEYYDSEGVAGLRPVIFLLFAWALHLY